MWFLIHLGVVNFSAACARTDTGRCTRDGCLLVRCRGLRAMRAHRRSAFTGEPFHLG